MTETASTETGRPVPTGFDHGDPEVIPHLHETLAELRDTCPVGWSDNYGGFWTFTRYDDVVTAARDHTHYTVSQGIAIPPTGGSIRLAPAEYDPPEHTAYRKIEMPFFSLSAVHAAEAMVRGCVRECFDRFVGDGSGRSPRSLRGGKSTAARGSADLVLELSDPVPPMVLARYLGLDETRSDEMRQLMVDFLSSARVSQQDKIVAAQALERFVNEQVDLRLGRPGDDTLNKIVNMTKDGVPLERAVVVGMVRLMISAGHETTVHGIGTLCYRVLTEPGVRERLLAAPELRKAAVLEALRMDPPVMHMARTVVDDHEREGQRLRKGDRVMVCYGAANRDPAKFSDPNRFDLDRGLAAHVTFGSGRHRCLGEHLAVAELSAVLDELLERIPDAAVAPGAEIRWTGGGITRGVESLPVVFTPRPS
jgi:cytochrome P450